MKALILLVALSLALPAVDDAEFVSWMKATDTAAKALKDMEQKTGPAATGNAERLELIYENMIGFWRRHNAREAVKWSEEGKAAAARLAAAARFGDADKADASLKSLSGTCRSCHDAHRERIAEGKFRILFQPRPAPEKR